MAISYCLAMVDPEFELMLAEKENKVSGFRFQGSGEGHRVGRGDTPDGTMWRYHQKPEYGTPMRKVHVAAFSKSRNTEPQCRMDHVAESTKNSNTGSDGYKV